MGQRKLLTEIQYDSLRSHLAGAYKVTADEAEGMLEAIDEEYAKKRYIEMMAWRFIGVFTMIVGGSVCWMAVFAALKVAKWALR